MAREKARQRQCANNLLQIGFALANYHDVHGRFPAAYLADPQGKPRSSWRLAIMPFISCSPFYDHYSLNDAWNSPSNLELTQRNDGYFYHCPSDYPHGTTTSYLAVTGTASAWPAPAASSLNQFSHPSHSILLAESANTGIHWLEPRDIEFDRTNLTIHAPSWAGCSSRDSFLGQAISSGHPTGANVLFADGSLEFLAADTEPERLKEMLVIRGSRQTSPLGPRHRLRLVFDFDSSQHGPKYSPFKIESYLTDTEDNTSQ
jgi:prepilin-type processing-associated H-X9-DG protein